MLGIMTIMEGMGSSKAPLLRPYLYEKTCRPLKSRVIFWWLQSCLNPNPFDKVRCVPKFHDQLDGYTTQMSVKFRLLYIIERSSMSWTIPKVEIIWPSLKYRIRCLILKVRIKKKEASAIIMEISTHKLKQLSLQIFFVSVWKRKVGENCPQLHCFSPLYSHNLMGFVQNLKFI